MNKKSLLLCCLALGLSLSFSANADNARGWGYWWQHYFGGGHHQCHTHSGNAAHHYRWARYFWWHRHCPNESPVADAGEDQSVVSGDTVNLDGTASSDPDGFITRYRWRQVSGPRVRLRQRRTATPHFVAPDVTEATELVFVLRVRDNHRGRDRDSVTVTVNPEVVVTQPPVADAGADQTVDAGTNVELNGLGSSDPDNDIVNYLWEQTAGTSVSLFDNSVGIVSFDAPAVTTAETLSFQLTVTDSEGSSDTDTVDVIVEPVVVLSQVNARARSIDASLVSGVELEFYVDGVLRNDLAATVNETATLMVDADTNYSIRASVDGFADQIIPFRSAAEGGNVDLDITLIPRGDVITISGAGSFSEEGADGAGVSFTTSDFVDADGNPVVGDIQLTITPVDVGEPATLAAFPGEFSGILEGSGDETPLISLGTVEFEFTANGQPINLAPGATADVLIPIYNFTYQDGTPIAVGDTIPLWSLSEDTGIWQQEGTGTVVASIDSPTGLALSATVTHFSWWNCDVSMNTATVEVTVLGTDNGTATVFGRTDANIGFRPSQVDTTIPVNSTTNPLFIPANAQTCLWAEVNFNSGASVTTTEQCVTPASGATLSVVFGTGSSEPLDVLASPGDASDVVNVNDFIESPIDPIILSPVSVETAVSYAITSGALPAGVSLSIVNATQAELAGISSESGTFNVTILATDDEGNTDEITVNFSISSEVEPPNIISAFDFVGGNTIVLVDLNNYNNGGSASAWLIDQPLLDGLSFDNAKGILTIDTSVFNEDCDGEVCTLEARGYFESDFTAINRSGSDTSRIFLQSFSLEGVSIQIGSRGDNF